MAHHSVWFQSTDILLGSEYPVLSRDFQAYLEATWAQRGKGSKKGPAGLNHATRGQTVVEPSWRKVVKMTASNKIFYTPNSDLHSLY